MKRKWKWLLPVLVLGILCLALIPTVLGSDQEEHPQLIAHTVNDLSFFETWQEKGLTGIYTDYFQPNHWPEFD